MTAVPAVPAHTIDTLLNGRVTLHQPKTGYRAGVDPVLLAAFAPCAPGDRVLDAGAGVGAVSLCLAARIDGCMIDAVEQNPTMVALLKASITTSRREARVTAHCADLAALPDSVRQTSYDWVLANPPFGAAGTPPPDAAKRAAHQEGSLDLAGWIGACAARARAGGGLALVQRADRLESVLAALAGRFGALEILPLWPRQGADAKRVLVRGRKGRAAPTRLLPGLILHDASGAYSEAAEAVLRGGAALGAARKGPAPRS